MSELLVPSRYCGPPSSGNGGWTAGALARLTGADGAVTVSLRKPPPLDTPMAVRVRDGVTEAVHGEHVVAQAEAADADVVPVEPVPADRAREAEAAYAGHTFHPFPTCFACGVAREAGDGLRIFPGQVGGADGAARTASTWIPDPSLASGGEEADGRVTLAVTWAALDCVGGWAGDLEERLMVLARMTARVDALPLIGEEHVVVGQARGSEGRKTWTAATLYDSDGRVVARAEHTWVAVNPADFA